jgi:hypothetical protein
MTNDIRVLRDGRDGVLKRFAQQAGRSLSLVDGEELRPFGAFGRANVPTATLSSNLLRRSEVWF